MAVPPLIWLAGAVGAVWLGLRKLQRYLSSSGGTVHDEAGTETVRCAHCAVFVPKSFAVEHKGRWYCSTEHAQLPQGNL